MKLLYRFRETERAPFHLWLHAIFLAFSMFLFVPISLPMKPVTCFFIIMIFAIAWDCVISSTSIFPNFEQTITDFKYRNFAPLQAPSDKIVFVDVDQISLDMINKVEGHWPWPRSVWQKTASAIASGQPKAILFDILLTEPDFSSPNNDQTFADWIQNKQNISFPVSFEKTASPVIARLPASVSLFSQGENLIGDTRTQFNSFSLPYPTLLNNVAHLHSVTSARDEDGIYRSMALWSNYQGHSFPSLSQKAVELFSNNSDIKIKKSNLDSKQQLPFHFYSSDFKTISLSSLYNLEKKKEVINVEKLLKHLKNQFQGKIVIIGSSAEALQDLKPTPIQIRYPGALLHAVSTSNIIEKHFLHSPFANRTSEVTLLLVCLIYIGFTYSQTRLAKIITPVLALGLYAVLSFYFFQVESILVPLVTPMIFGCTLYFNGVIYFGIREKSSDNFASLMTSHSAK